MTSAAPPDRAWRPDTQSRPVTWAPLEKLAETAGVSVRALSDMERGRALGPQRRMVALIADGLKQETPSPRTDRTHAQVAIQQTIFYTIVQGCRLELPTIDPDQLLDLAADDDNDPH